MRDVVRDVPYFPASSATPSRWAVWNRRLLILAAVVILWSASVLTLQMAGPEAQAFLAGEGMLINDLR
jgi:hypothetical protein